MPYRVLVQMTGTHDGKDWPKKDEVVPDDEFSADEIADYLNMGIIEPVPDIPPVETSTPDTKPRRKPSGLTKERTGL